MGLSKLVSRIPPPPRVPKVDGVSLIAPTVSERPPADDGAATATGAQSMPRWRKRQISRARTIVGALGAIVAALLVGALLAWATQP